MMRLLFINILFFFSFSTFAETGVLFLAHGSMKGCGYENPTKWEKYVLDAVGSIKTKDYVEVAFGMWNTKCFDMGIKRLSQKMKKRGKKLDHLRVIPLFISSYSVVIEMQKYIFKKRKIKVLPIPMAQKTSFKGQITYEKAIDYDPHISMILANRAHSLLHEAHEQGFDRSQMTYVLVMHGPVSPMANKKWLAMGKRYLEDIQYLFPISRGYVISLQDDAPGPVRDRATKKLQKLVNESHQRGGTALILPLLISKGGIEEGIIKRLKGLEYTWRGETLLPDPHFIKFLESRLSKI